MNLEMCFGRYSSIIFAMNEYRGRHEALYELLPTPIANDDMTFTHSLTTEDTHRIKPYMLMLESLLESMITLLNENTDRLRECLSQYDTDMKRYFGKALMDFEIDPSVAQH